MTIVANSAPSLVQSSLVPPRARQDEAAHRRVGYLFVAFFTIPFLPSTSCRFLRRLRRFHPMEHRRLAALGRADNFYDIAQGQMGVHGLRQCPALRPHHRAERDCARAAVRALRQQTLPALRPCAHVLLRAERHVRDRHRPGLGLAPRHAIRPGQPLPGLSGHLPDTLAHLARWSLFGVSIASVWWDLGLAFVLFLAALQDIPSKLIEAAHVDGAGGWSALSLHRPAAPSPRALHGG